MDEKTFKERTKRFGINIIQATEKLPNTRIADILARQIIRSATSVGANYRAACRAKSTADMINKLKTVSAKVAYKTIFVEVTPATLDGHLSAIRVPLPPPVTESHPYWPTCRAFSLSLQLWLL